MGTIAVVGAGYVGLTTSASMASLGHEVIGIDIDEGKVLRLNRGEIDILEPGLEDLVREGLRGGRLRFSSTHGDVADVEFVFLCVPTPPAVDGRADLVHLVAAAEAIGPHLRTDSVVLIKSTVPVGSSRVVERAIGRQDVSVVSNPEFLREGHAVYDCLNPDRLVVGAVDESMAIRVFALYAGIVAPLVVTDPATAELTKYAANAFLATKLSFVNAIAVICDEVGADIDDLVLGLGYDKRIGAEFLRPGPGWGGSCLPKDTRALAAAAADAGYDFTLLSEVIAVNERQIARVVEKLTEALSRPLSGSTIAVWGLTFKAGTGDLRESPALAVAMVLEAAGVTLRGFDPTVDSATVIGAMTIEDDPVSAARGAHAVLLMTEWDEFRWIDAAELAEAMKGDLVVDTRNILRRGSITQAGLRYVGTGRR